MVLLHKLWFLINSLLIVLILIRSPNEQNLQGRLSSFKFFDSYGSAEKTLDNLIKILIFGYFSVGFLLMKK